MKQKKGNIVALEIGTKCMKALLGSCNETASTDNPFFELYGVVKDTRGISKKGIIHSKAHLEKSVEHTLNTLRQFSGYGADETHILYTYPGIRYFTKTIGTKNIREPDGIFITESWLSERERSIAARIKKMHPQEACTHLRILAIIADGEDVTHDPFEYNAIRSLAITFAYTLTPAAFIETIREITEKTAGVVSVQPTAIANEFFLSDTQKEEGAVVCDVGANMTTITACREGVIAGISVAPFGGNTVTNEIALIKQVSLDEAENIKHAMHENEQQLKKREIQSLEKKITAHIKKHIVPNIKQAGALKDFPGGIVLVGGGARYLNFEKILQKTTGLYVTHAAIPHHIQSQGHDPRTVWQSVYGLLCAVTIEDIHAGRYARGTKRSPWNTVSKMVDNMSKILR